MAKNFEERQWFRADEISSTDELISLFKHLLDERRFDEAEALVTPDITYENSRGVVAGWPAVRRGMEALKCFSATQHLIGNHLGSWDGDLFFGKTYCIAYHIYQEDGQERRYEMGIFYDELIVRICADLKIKRRTLKRLWTQNLT